jgi:uncharacterized membrane protein YczE
VALSLALLPTSGDRPSVRARRFAQLLGGLVLYGLAISLEVRAGIGLSPWDVLAQGVSNRTGIPFGLVTNLVGALVLLFWIPLRQRPGLGTVLNVIMIGPSAQLGLWLVPQQTEPVLQGLLFAAGLALLAIATGLYIGARMGPGPRDGLMTGLRDRTGWPVWIVRTSLEGSVLVIGWILGGQVGIGTVAFALLVGPLVNITMPLFHVPEADGPQPPIRERLRAQFARRRPFALAQWHPWAVSRAGRRVSRDTERAYADLSAVASRAGRVE